MATIRLLIAFDGTNYHGWQRQHHDITVQEVIEEKLALICKQKISLHGAGRTDAGVHAEGMVAHFEVTDHITPVTAYMKGLNSMLPKDIRILEATLEVPSFHSRFGALAKTYRYDFFTGDIQPPGKRLYAAHIPYAFDADRLQPAINALTGTHDFSSFEHAGSRNKEITTGRGATRTIYKIECNQPVNQPFHWTFRFTGDGFLRQMVRILTGTLFEIGTGNRSPHSIPHILKAKKRCDAGITAPAHGLFLEKIFYRKIFRS